MGAEKKKQMGVLGLIVALVVVLMGGVLFVGAVSGWFDDPKIRLSEEYYGEFGDFANLTGEEYERLVGEGKSFVVFVDQEGCDTADKLEGFVRNWASNVGVRVYRMMFENAKETSLHDFVKYYPSLVMVSRGKPVAWLRADADEDADAYNEEGVFREWSSRYL